MPLGRPSIVQPGSNALPAIQQFASNVRERFASVDAAIAALQVSAANGGTAASSAALLSLTNQIAALTRRVLALENEEFAQIDVPLIGESGLPITANPDANDGTSFLIDATDDFTLQPINGAESGRTYTIIVVTEEPRTLTLDNNYISAANITTVSMAADSSTLIRATANLDEGTQQMLFLCTIDESMTFIDIRGTEDDLDVRVSEDDDTRIAE